MIGITGKHSSIIKEFVKLTDEKAVFGSINELPKDLERYVLCAGVLAGKNARDIDDAEAIQTFRVNFLDVVRFCDELFEKNARARGCAIGSMSGILGSYDTAYAGSKAALHLYVETKKLLHPTQHLVCVAPTIIEDSGMTQRRADLEEVLQRGKQRRLQRWLRAEEVARIAHFALQEDALCNTVVRATGGNW